MINRLLLYCAAFLLFCLGSCATSVVPQIVIPQHAGQMDLNASIGSNGANVNLLYAPAKRFFITSAFHRSLFSSDDDGTIYGELGTGMVSRDGKTSLGLTCGYGKFSFYPHFIDFVGQTNPFELYYGHYLRTSLILNLSFPGTIGISSRLDVYTGQDNGVINTYMPVYPGTFYKRPIGGANFEPAVYYKSKKRSGFIYFTGFDLAIYASHKETDPVYFRLPFVFVSMGWNFNLIKGRNAVEAPSGNKRGPSKRLN